MGLFSRKKEKRETPELPQLPRLPSIPFQNTDKLQDIPMTTETDFRKSVLPSFPNSNLGNQMNQSTIKEAIGESNINNQRNEKKDDDFSQMTPSIVPKMPSLNRERALEIPNWHNQNAETRVKRTDPIFVKLEKYESALSTFNEIKLRISEIDSLLSDIREVKRKEETELEEWQTEIETIKARLDQIDKEIFNRL